MNRPSKSLETPRSRITSRFALPVIERKFSRPSRSNGLYHWVRMMEGNINTTFSEIEIAGERALSRTTGGVRMAFGLGPATAGERSELRSLEILKALHPEIQGLRWGRQVHGSEVAVVANEAGVGVTGSVCVGSCDAFVTAEAGVGLMVWTADCVPILLGGPGVVAAIHSGWRGTAADIVGVVLRRLERDYGVSPDQLWAALGPAISGTHYEVGPEVIAALETLGLESDEWRRRDRVDLRLFLASRLRQLGVDGGSIGVIGPCTYSSPHLASYRRDGNEAGRQFSLIYRRDGDVEAAGDGARCPRS